MKIDFRPLDFDSIKDFELLASWENDPTIKHLIRPHKTPESYEIVVQAVDLQNDYKKHHESGGLEQMWMLEINGEIVGNGSVMMNPRHRMTQKSEKVAWIGLEIGDAKWRGQGLGKKLLKFLEDQALGRGAEMIEVGIFEFNKVSLSFFQSSGYQIIGKLDHYTFWQDKMWADFRLTKSLI